ncbi:hypothetical protein LT679_01100 [Mucilaginibacter roseus]|uniref:Lipocalin-like domain-containing protein n=1 Tax=Mucilaginibacter roseus TaxID=1528868 RepID=A0ABS8TWB9_9SPHI|nr:hypothetical protein [Mucilaginibacter roseus]MCD8739183.1 hypothetical protein [Mucilaginibacter roseus]
MGFQAADIKDKVEVVGTYRLTDHSKKIMQYEGDYVDIPESYLIIYRNGTYKLNNAPDWIMDDWGKSNKSYIDHTEKWSISFDDNGHCIFELNDISAGDILQKKDGKLNVLLTVGVPDNCQGMVYEEQ